MLYYLKNLYRIIIHILKSKYKWMLILFVLWLYRVDFIPADGEGLAKGLQVVTIFGMLGLVLIYKNNIVQLAYQQRGTPVKTILWLYTFALISTVWAFMPTFAFFLSFQNLVLIFVLTWMFGEFKDFKSMEKGFIYLAILMMLFEVVTIRVIEAPKPFIHFLPGGSSAAVCFSYCIGELLSEKRKDTPRIKFLKRSMIVSLLVLITSTSSGANVSAIFGFGLALLLSGRTKYAIPLLIGSAILYIDKDLLDSLILFVMPGKTKEIIESGNGRETIWNGIMAVTAARPLYGWGFACGERVASSYLNWTLSDAHNNYLGLYGGLGLTGIGLLILHQIATIWQTFIRRMKIGYLGLFCALCCASANGYTYGYLSGKTCSITVIYFAMLVLAFYYSKVKTYGQAIKR